MKKLLALVALLSVSGGLFAACGCGYTDVAGSHWKLEGDAHGKAFHEQKMRQVKAKHARRETLEKHGVRARQVEAKGGPVADAAMMALEAPVAAADVTAAAL